MARIMLTLEEIERGALIIRQELERRGLLEKANPIIAELVAACVKAAAVLVDIVYLPDGTGQTTLPKEKIGQTYQAITHALRKAGWPKGEKETPNGEQS